VLIEVSPLNCGVGFFQDKVQLIEFSQAKLLNYDYKKVRLTFIQAERGNLLEKFLKKAESI
jgi:hypothetical protein